MWSAVPGSASPGLCKPSPPALGLRVCSTEARPQMSYENEAQTIAAHSHLRCLPLSSGSHGMCGVLVRGPVRARSIRVYG